jgi:hypothetical protein
MTDILDASREEEARSRQLLSTTECARALGMTGAFIRGEIRDGRLKARIFTEGRRRAKYRIEAVDFRAYVERCWPKAG